MADPGLPDSGSSTGQLRIGTLSAARITPPALIEPARLVPEAVVTMRLIDDIYRAAGLRPRGMAGALH